MLTRVETFFAREVADFRARLANLEASLDPAAPVTHNAAYDQLTCIMHDAETACRRLQATIGADADLLADTQQRFQAATSSFFEQSWIGNRARMKPRGYPGDYLLLNTIYNRQPMSPGLGGYLDLYIMDLLLAQSVRARWRQLRQFLNEELAERTGDVAVMNVACGPCREYLAGIDPPEGVRVHVTCLDNDQEALDFVQANIIPEARGVADIRCARYNALRMKSANATIRNFGRSDVIYSIGLCDYIEDPYMIEMLAGWRESLAEGGVMFVAFKDIRRYDPTPYQWLLDWHFFPRTEEDCRALFEKAGFDTGGLEMSRDATGVIMSFVSRVKAATTVRFDAPETAAKPPVWTRDDATAPHMPANVDAIDMP